MVWLVRIPEVPGTEVEWVAVDAGSPASGRGSIAELKAAMAVSGPRQSLALLLPAARSLVTPVVAPTRNPRQLQQALPYLVEETLATDVDSLHIVAGRRLATGRVQVVAADRGLLHSALDALRREGLDPEIITIDALLLPLPASGATLWLDGPRSLLASASGLVLAMDAADAELALSTLDLGAAPGSELRLHVAGDTDLLVANAVASAQGEAVQAVVDAQHPTLLSLLATDTASRLREAANLRQGAFARQASGSLDLGFDWRPLAGMAAAWVLVATGYLVAQGIAHGRAADALREAEVALYRQLFPGVAQVPDPRRQMQGQINAGAGADAVFTRLVAEASAAVTELDNGSGRYSTRSLSWDKAQGQLRMDMVARSLEEIETLRQKLEARGLRVDIGAGVSQDGGYKARINLEVGA